MWGLYLEACVVPIYLASLLGWNSYYGEGALTNCDGLCDVGRTMVRYVGASVIMQQWWLF